MKVNGNLLNEKLKKLKKDPTEFSVQIEKIKTIHGCHVIVNGIIHSLKYYLRLLENPAEFISNYVNLLEQDTSLKFEHKKMWNEVVVNSQRHNQ